MKTAKQIREMMNFKTKPKIIKRVLEIIEKDIIKAADEGDIQANVYISSKVCPKMYAGDVVGKLVKNGYTTKAILINDARYGDCVQFIVKWKEDK